MFELIEVKYQKLVDIPHLYITKGLTVLLGASGSGKTTVLKLLNKMISPTQGRILFYSNDLKQIHSVGHRRNVMMLSQNPAMFEGNIKDNLTIAFRFQAKEIPVDEELYRILAKVQLDKGLDTPVNQLSGGEKQRLALGRIFLLNPSVYLLDEPSSALDENTEDIIIKMVSEHIKKADKSALMVTHSKSVAEKYGDEIIEMAQGKILYRRLRDEWNN
jgi:putative ABC transport system ATP-binding protein